MEQLVAAHDPFCSISSSSGACFGDDDTEGASKQARASVIERSASFAWPIRSSIKLSLPVPAWEVRKRSSRSSRSSFWLNKVDETL